MKLLIDHNADVNAKSTFDMTSLMFASVTGQIDVVKLLIENNHADVNGRNLNNMTALMVAAQRGKINVGKYLVYMRADKNMRDIDGCTAKEIALKHDHNQFANEMDSWPVCRELPALILTEQVQIIDHSFELHDNTDGTIKETKGY